MKKGKKEIKNIISITKIWPESNGNGCPEELNIEAGVNEMHFTVFKRLSNYFL